MIQYKNKSPLISGIIIAIMICLIDQLSKLFLLELMVNARAPIEITSFFRLVMVFNRGVSFGMFADYHLPWLFITLSVVISAVLFGWLLKAGNHLEAAAIGLIIGGAFGNVIDRLRFGAVADFFDFHLAGYHWPAFNIADSAIFIGVVVLVVKSIMRDNAKAT